jgi:aspartate aminotransferase
LEDDHLVIKLASRLASIQPSATAEMFRRVAELRAQGVALISLAVGEPDFAPPAEILAAARRALESGPFGYTQVAGLPALRAAICAQSKTRRGIEHGPDQVVVSAGAKHSLFQLATALFDPGDEVIIPTPSWVSYADQVRLCGATPVFVPGAASDDFLPRIEAIEAALTSRTRALILCTPNNPTGAAWSGDDLARLSKLLRRTGLLTIVDEIYAELYYDGPQAPSLLQIAPDLRDQVVIVDGVSKTYAMTGFRVGWILAPRELARACETLQSQSTTSIATVAQLATIAALSGDQSCVERMRSAYRERREHVLRGLRERLGWPCREPRGAFYVFPDVSGWFGRKAADRVLANDVDVAEFLLAEARVALVPGSAFGGPGHVRVSYAAGLAEIDQAIERMAQAATTLR